MAKHRGGATGMSAKTILAPPGLVRFGGGADDFRSTPINRHFQCPSVRLRSAINRLMRRSKALSGSLRSRRSLRAMMVTVVCDLFAMLRRCWRRKSNNWHLITSPVWGCLLNLPALPAFGLRNAAAFSAAPNFVRWRCLHCQHRILRYSGFDHEQDIRQRA